MNRDIIKAALVLGSLAAILTVTYTRDQGPKITTPAQRQQCYQLFANSPEDWQALKQGIKDSYPPECFPPHAREKWTGPVTTLEKEMYPRLVQEKLGDFRKELRDLLSEGQEEMQNAVSESQERMQNIQREHQERMRQSQGN